MSDKANELWLQLRDGLTREVAELPASELRWLAERLARVARLKEELHGIFLDHGGETICATCRGACCDYGRNHLTLVDMLACLIAEKPLPDPDFSRRCPYLDEQACHFLPSQRPFNCLTFLCERIEAAIPEAALLAFYRKERELRALYDEFELRYAGASLRGIFIRAGRLGKVSLLGSPTTDL